MTNETIQNVFNQCYPATAKHQAIQEPREILNQKDKILNCHQFLEKILNNWMNLQK
jgi:hypothetical protein